MNDKYPNSRDTRSWIEVLRRTELLPESYTAAVFTYVAPLAERITGLREKLARPVVVGISGAQGSGKSTLALFLTNWLQREMRLATACLSIDDFYLRRADREKLSRTRHPLLATRGVPGTHDVKLGMRILKALTDAETRQPVALPAFDKATDDRLPESKWPQVEAPVDVVLLEGWCVGAKPQADAGLAAPINALEADEDTDAAWRGYVNERLRSDYAELFSRLDTLIMLRIPSFEKVLEWRRLQERKLRVPMQLQQTPTTAARGQSDAELVRFIQHYERLTRYMLETMPDYADTVIDIDDEHRLVAMNHRD